jgi:hypothetical protein
MGSQEDEMVIYDESGLGDMTECNIYISRQLLENGDFENGNAFLFCFPILDRSTWDIV